MGAKTQDALVETLKRVMQSGEGNGAALADLPAGTSTDDLEVLFLAELRSRRERLARWMQLIQQEVERESAPRRRTSRRGPQCRHRATGGRATRSR